MLVHESQSAAVSAAGSPAAGTVPRGRVRWSGAIWFIAPLLLHLSLQAAHAFLDRAPDFDEAIYMGLARSIVRTGMVLSSDYPPKPFLIHPPLFYYLVALSFAILGPGLEAGRVVSTLFAAGTLGLVFSLLRRWRGEGWAAAGTLLAAVNPAFLYYGHSVYMEMTVAFWMMAALWAFSRAGEQEDLRWERRAGIFLGLACVTKYYAAVMVAVLAFAVLTEGGRSRVSRIRRLVALLGPVALAGLAWVGLGMTMGTANFIGAHISWGQPDLSGANFSWRHVSNAVFVRELVGVLTPVFSGLALLGLAAATRRAWRSLRGGAQMVFWIFPIAYFLFLMTFREKDVKYIVPLIPILSVLIGLAPPKEWARRLPAWSRWAGVLGLAALASPLLPLYDPVTGQKHDNLWVFGIRRDAEYRLYRDAGIVARRESAPGQVVVCQRKGPIIGYYADRPYLDLWGFSPEVARPYLLQAEVVVLDRNTEYLSPEDWQSFRLSVEAEFRPITALPGPENPILEIFRRPTPERRAP